MIDVDQILHDHAADAAEVEPAAEGWARLVARLEVEPPLVVSIDGDPSGASGRSSRWVLAAAAAVVAVVLAAGAVALVRAGDEEGGERPVATEVPDPTTTTTRDGGTGRPHLVDEEMPDTVVAVVDHDGDQRPDLVRIEGIGTTEDVPGPGGTTARGLRAPEVTVLVAGSAIDEPIEWVEVGPDGLVLFGVRGSPPGEVRAVDLADGRPHAAAGGQPDGVVALGHDPATTADGRYVATIGQQGDVLLYDLDARAAAPRRFVGPPEGDEVTGVSISPDGTQIARQRVTRYADGTIDLTAVDVTSVDDRAGWTQVERSSGAGLPAFMEGGHLALGLGTTGASEGQLEVRASEVGMAELATGEVHWSVGGGGFSFRRFDSTPDGRWVLALHDGVVRAFAAVDGWLWDSGTVVQLDGLIDVAW